MVINSFKKWLFIREVGNAQNAGTLALPQASGNVIILVHVFIMLAYFVFLKKESMYINIMSLDFQLYMFWTMTIDTK